MPSKKRRPGAAQPTSGLPDRRFGRQGAKEKEATQKRKTAAVQQADAARQEAKRRALTLTKWELGVVVVLAVLLPMRYFEDSSPMVHMIYGRFNLMTENLGDWLLDLFGLRSLVEGW